MAGRDRDARNGMTFPLRWSPRSIVDFLSRPGWLLRMRETPSPTFVNYGKRASIGAMLFGIRVNAAAEAKRRGKIPRRWQSLTDEGPN